MRRRRKIKRSRIKIRIRRIITRRIHNIIEDIENDDNDEY